MDENCEMYECVKCKKEINIQKIDKCTKGCNSFKCPKWLCSVEMHIDKDGDIKTQQAWRRQAQERNRRRTSTLACRARA